MRIIAGKHRGRRLLGPEHTRATRPITDRVKTALFDRLDAAGLIEGATVLDLFAGTGSMGLECLSRGAAHVTFVERDRAAVRRLRRNIEVIARGDEGRVLGVNALSGSLIEAVADRVYGLVFVDPPYAMWRDRAKAGRLRRQMVRLAGVCEAQARLIVRTERGVAPWPIDGWGEVDSRTIGTMTIHVCRRTESPSAEGGSAAG